MRNLPEVHYYGAQVRRDQCVDAAARAREVDRRSEYAGGEAAGEDTEYVHQHDPPPTWFTGKQLQ